MNGNRTSSPSKKRKIDDAKDATDGGDIQLPPERNESNIMAKLDRMEQMMMTVVDKLATVSSLESRCEQLESKCNNVESKFEARLDSMHNNLVNACGKLDKVEKKLEGKIDSLRDRARHYHEHNTMLLKNQSWEYSSKLLSKNYYMMQGHDHDDAVHLVETAAMLKGMTMIMRRGEFPHEREGKSIILRPCHSTYYQYDSSVVFQHRKEFVAALKQFHPVVSLLPEENKSSFTWEYIYLDRKTILSIKDALIGAPFQKMAFEHNVEVVYECGGLNVNDILDVMESNKRLQYLEIRLNRIRNDHIERICSLVHNHPALKELSLPSTMAEAGVGNALLRALLMQGDLKLRKLSMPFSDITSDMSTLLADFIASNPMLEELNLRYNELTESDAILLANALRTNTTLQCLRLEGNFDITENGKSVIRSVVCDHRSLNTLADSNHCCCLPGLHENLSNINNDKVMKNNRGKKIYSLLCYRNIFESNIPHFSDIDVKILPDMLAAIQGCAKLTNKEFLNSKMSCLSIVYEVMRKWEKVFNVYESIAMWHEKI